jgi:hypothetical protein
MNDEFDKITTLEELWGWCRNHRESAWRLPEKWEVLGYSGDLVLGVVADVPAPRSLEHRNLGLPYANDVDVFTTDFDRRLYRLMAKYGIGSAHLMDTHISIVPNEDQDKRVFLKQIEIVKPGSLANHGWTNERCVENGPGVSYRVERYATSDVPDVALHVPISDRRTVDV